MTPNLIHMRMLEQNVEAESGLLSGNYSGGEEGRNFNVMMVGKKKRKKFKT